MRTSVALILALACALLISHPASAQDIAPITSTLDSLHGFMQSPAIRTLAALAVIGLGITAMLGHLRWGWVASIIGGIVLIFGADSIVAFFTSSAGA